MEYPTWNNTAGNYDFVPLLDGNRGGVNENSPVYEGKINLKLHSESPVYVGSGQETLIDGRLCRALIRNADGFPILPGSSIKGVVRTIAQSVSYSGSCAELLRIYTDNRGKEKLGYFSNTDCKCLVCTMLGCMGTSSRVYFSDFKATGSDTEIINALKPFSVSDSYTIKQKYFIQDKPKGFKFYPMGDVRNALGSVPTECVKAGTTFIGEVVYKGITERHLEILCFSLGLDGSFPLRVGGNKPGFFGVVRPEILSFTCYSSGSYKNLKIHDLSEESKQMDPVKLASEYGKNDSDVCRNIDKLRDILNRKV
jgi:CRISPR/Cas system CSM-associated protein Csm3 (group 7 of RAMP superfamily)